jgi:hypothetical protein
MHAARDYEDYDAQYDAVAFEEEHSDGEDQHHDVAVIGRTGKELTCLLCHSAGHLFRQCPGLEARARSSLPGSYGYVGESRKQRCQGGSFIAGHHYETGFFFGH